MFVGCWCGLVRIQWNGVVVVVAIVVVIIIVVCQRGVWCVFKMVGCVGDGVLM